MKHRSPELVRVVPATVQICPFNSTHHLHLLSFTMLEPMFYSYIISEQRFCVNRYRLEITRTSFLG
jgi:hypothetical protein